MTVQIQTPKQAYTFDYPQAIAFAETQESIFWTATEINVEKDIQDIRVNMTEAEAHGVITTLKLFTLYELVAGRDYWLGRVMRRFPRPDINRMAACFGFFELNVHAPFYNKINEALMVNTDEFYTDYVKDETLKARMDFVEDIVRNDDDLLSLAAFSLVEGAVLYSSFAFLKHFQARGKNKLMNVVRGINFSVRDENLHCEGGAWLYHQLLTEKLQSGELNQEGVGDLEKRILQTARNIALHEFRIVDMIFEKGGMEGITPQSMKSFIKSRLLLCLSKLGIELGEEVGDNPIAEWFYTDINAVQLHDFFTGIGNQYNRNWDQSKLTWRPV